MRHDTAINNLPAFILQWKQSNRMQARYRDQYGFSVWGIVLSVDEKESKIVIANWENCVSISALIETKQI